MNTQFVNNQLSQMSLAVLGKCGNAPIYGISMSKFNPIDVEEIEK